MESKKFNGRTILAHVVLIILSFMCLFFFYILIINATRSHAQLQLGFSALPGSSLITNFLNVIDDPAIPILKGIQNSLIVSGCCAAIVTYFSALTAYGIYAYDFKLKNAAFTFIMAILVMPTQVTALGFLRLITNMGMDDSLLPLIIPSVASRPCSTSCTATCSPPFLKSSLRLRELMVPGSSGHLTALSCRS